MRLPQQVPPRPAPATMHSFAAGEKSGRGWAGCARARGSVLRRAIRRQFAPTPSTPVLQLSPVSGLRLRSASGPRPDPSNLDRTSDDLQNQYELQRPERRRGTPTELVVPLNTS